MRRGKRMKKKIIISVCLLLCVLLAACGEQTSGTDETTVPAETSGPATLETTVPATEETTEPTMTFPGPEKVDVASYGLQIPIPDDLKEKVVVQEQGYVYSDYTMLYTIRHRESVAQYITDTDEYNEWVGVLFYVCVATEEQFEENKNLDNRMDYFARDEEKGLYYGFRYTTPEGSGDYMLVQTSLYETLPDSIIQANGLTPFTDNQQE